MISTVSLSSMPPPSLVSTPPPIWMKSFTVSAVPAAETSRNPPVTVIWVVPDTEPVSVVVPSVTVIAPAPVRAPEMVPPESVVSPEAESVPAISPPDWLKLVAVSTAAPVIVPPV